MSRIKQKINKINEYLALKITEKFSSMYTFYFFFIWGLLAFIPALSNYKETILLISSAWIQLWALPALAVGQIVGGRTAEKRAKVDHKHIVEMHQFIHDHLLEQDAILHEIKTLVSPEDKPVSKRTRKRVIMANLAPKSED